MALLNRPGTLVWLFLMLATCVTTWGLSKDQFSASVATLAIILIAAIKIRLVLLHFMELRHAPLPWRLLMEAWVLLVTGAIEPHPNLIFSIKQAGVPVGGILAGLILPFEQALGLQAVAIGESWARRSLKLCVRDPGALSSAARSSSITATSISPAESVPWRQMLLPFL